MTYREVVNHHLLVHGLISYGDAMNFAKEYKRKAITINRFLQNDKKEGRQWGFIKLDFASKPCKKNAPWVFKKLTPKGYARLKKQMKMIAFSK